MKAFQISILDDYNTMSEKAAKWLVKHIGRAIAARGYCVFVPSAGRTPGKVYEILRDKYRTTLDWTRVVVIQMDEYAGLPLISPKSFGSYLLEHLVLPLGIERFHTFFDTKGELNEPFAATDRRIGDLGGIDVVLYGVGENGHLGLNEPGAPENSSTGYVRLSDVTLVSNAGCALAEARQLLPSEGVTLGLGVLLEARKSLLIASGERKREAVSRFIMDGVSAASPSTFLRARKCVTVMITPDCAPNRWIMNQVGPTTRLNSAA